VSKQFAEKNGGRSKGLDVLVEVDC